MGDKFGSEDSDFSVVCEDKEIRCHKLILAAQSGYFKTLFTQTGMEEKRFNENHANNVTIEDIEFDTMHLLLSYLYFLKLPESLQRAGLGTSGGCRQASGYHRHAASHLLSSCFFIFFL